MKKKFVAVVMSVLVALSLSACAGNGNDKSKETGTQQTTNEAGTKETGETVTAGGTAEATDSGKSYVIGYSPATLNNAFWLAVEDGVKKAIEEKGAKVNLVEVDANGDQSIMNDRISDLISSGIDALLLAPADSTACTSALNQLKDAGVPVINFDTPVDAADLVETIIASDNYNAGYVVGADAAQKMKDGAKILVLHSPRASACVQRYDGFIKALDESGKKYTVVNVLDGKGDQETSMGLVADAVVADPDLSIIFAVNDPSAMGAVNAIDQSSVTLENKIMVYGVDGNPDAKTMVKNGKMEGTGAQSPETLGYDSMIAALTFLEGGTLEKNVVVDTFLISADNVDQYGTDGWQ
ncbi:MAG TPA: sugar ABC transporter substrate-binding protein [Clostridiales bacterium]|nr:sugar ABC transporter substrate-binding protein [Clostridiales bacterium]